MGTIDRMASGRYYARWRTPDGKSRSKSLARKRDAEAHLVDVEGAKIPGGYIDPSRARVKVGPWADDWLAGKTNLTPKTRDRYDDALEVHIKPRWAEVQLAQVTHADVQRWIASIERAPATVRKIHRVVSQILATAVRDGRRPQRRRGHLPPRARHGEALLVPCPGGVHGRDRRTGWQMLVRFLAYTGLRWGEVAALRVSRVDIARQRIVFAESVSPVKGVMVWGSTKGHELREVAIPQFLLPKIEHLIRDRSPDSLLFIGPRGRSPARPGLQASSAHTRHRGDGAMPSQAG